MTKQIITITPELEQVIQIISNKENDIQLIKDQIATLLNMSKINSFDIAMYEQSQKSHMPDNSNTSKAGVMETILNKKEKIELIEKEIAGLLNSSELTSFDIADYLRRKKTYEK